MALQIFPTEVWELILDYVKEVPDILNVLNTFPELQEEGVQHAKKTKWLFPSIILVLYEWLSKEDNGNCRQVCKTWRNGIEDFTSMDGCPYNNKKKSNYMAVPGPFQTEIWFKFRMLRDFTTVEELNRFHKDMVEYNHDREPSMNPFLMRRASFKDGFLSYSVNPMDLGPDHVHFWDAVLDFLKTYGQHLWHLVIDIKMDDSRSPSNILNFLNGFLEHVPNLKSLRYYFWDQRRRFRGEGSNKNCLLQNVAFALPKLESIFQSASQYLEDSCEFITKSVIRHFGKGLGRLDIHVSDWEENYTNHFTNLTELNLMMGGRMDGNQEKDVQILSSIQAPNLAKLVIDTRFYRNSERLWENIIPVLARFHKLEYLTIWGSGSTGRYHKACDDRITKLPSVKFVKILVNELGFDTSLLSCFPNVNNLYICCAFRETSFCIQNREIWEIACPELQEVVLDMYAGNPKRVIKRIFRSHYEHFQSCRDKKCVSFEDQDSDIELADLFGRNSIMDDE